MRHTFYFRLCCGIMLAASFGQLIGCGGPPEAPKREYADVSGTVTHNGKPLGAGTVMFQPPSGALASGEIQANGTYSLKGVIGPNTVTIANRAEAPPSAESRASGAPPVEAKPQIPEKYATPAGGLTYEVKAGENKADFNLQ